MSKTKWLLGIHLAACRMWGSSRVSSLAPNEPVTGSNIWCVLYGSPSTTSSRRETSEGIGRQEDGDVIKNKIGLFLVYKKNTLSFKSGFK